jgi:hypothetical protein
MSSKLAMAFGDTYQDDYRKVATKWAKKLSSSGKLSDKTRSEWGIDLQDSLGEQVIDGLIDHTLSSWKNAGSLPPKDILQMYAKIAAKGALAVNTIDLLHRLKDAPTASDTEFGEKSENLTIFSENPTVFDENQANFTEFSPMTKAELIKRSSQTLSQIFDMAQDRFNGLVNKYLTKTDQSTGKRRWVTVASTSGPSRHAALDGEVRDEDEDFIFEGESVYGPRPPGGSPAHWSNCSCYISYIGKNGRPLNR